MSLSPTPALVDYLAADGTLGTLAPGGVFQTLAPPADDGQTAAPIWVRVLLEESAYDGSCGGLWACQYAISGMGVAEAITQLMAVQDRIDVLLFEQGPVLAGWRVVSLNRPALLETPELDTESGLRYEMRGARYELSVVPL